MFRIATGHSDLPEGRAAIAAALEQCARNWSGGVPAGAILLAGPHYDHAAILTTIDQHHPGLPLIGCTTDGEFSSGLGYREDSVHLLLLGGDGVEISTGLGRDVSLDPQRATEDAIRQANQGATQDPSLCFTFPDGVTANVSAVVDGLQRALGRQDLPVLGGASGDHREFARSRQFFDGLVTQDTVPVMLLRGDFRFSVGVASGWRPLGETMEVTRSIANVVLEIDHRPALEVYKALLGDSVGPGSYADFPLAVYGDPQNPAEFQLRAPFFVDDEEQSLTFAGDVPTGSRVKISQARRDDVLAGALTSAQTALDRFPGRDPRWAFVVSCAGRKYGLGDRFEEESDALCDALVDRESTGGPELSGFYSFGEIAPSQEGGASRFHNETCVTVLVGNE